MLRYRDRRCCGVLGSAATRARPEHESGPTDTVLSAIAEIIGRIYLATLFKCFQTPETELECPQVKPRRLEIL